MSLTFLLNKTCKIGSSDVPCRLRLRDFFERKYGTPNLIEATCAIYVEEKNYTQEDYIILNEKKYNIIGSLPLGGKTKIRCLYARSE